MILMVNRPPEPKGTTWGKKLTALVQVYKSVLGVQGLAAECGVWQGYSLRALARSQPGRSMVGFDTFTGLPAGHQNEIHQAGEFGDTSLEAVTAALASCKNVQLVPGLFPGSAAQFESWKFAFAYIDFDFYESTVAAIDWFLPRLVPGAVLAFDDYDWKHCPGVARAIAEKGLTVTQPVPHLAVYRHK